ncbi:hypothetical protein BGW38_009101 [Lunasporangiospora selenospora]|uniref:t-SNARE coiled-coil homology domain-containing protein n=1 Tax=Lunasporangiospora selenospora TaxID=979761 RepID=A0A9P6FXT3_9FUNG|nr:hypothetical protein BGW38_009101 [Lunasporangiospora selenospora]
MDSSGGLTQRRPPTSSGAGVSRNGLIDRSHSPQLAHHGTVPGPGGPGAGAWGDHHHSGSSASGISSAHHYHQGISQSASSTVRAGTTPVDSNPSAGMLDYENDFEQGLSAEQRQMLELENENIVQRLETELNQVRHIETSMLELSSLHSTIQEHLEVQTQQTNRLHDEALAAIDLISSGNDQLIKAGQRNQSTRKWILFFLILASFVLLFLDWYD